MNSIYKLICRGGHIWSVSASLALWFFLASMVPASLLQSTQGLVERGMSSVTKILLASSSPADLSIPSTLCGDLSQRSATIDCSSSSL